MTQAGVVQDSLRPKARLSSCVSFCCLGKTDERSLAGFRGLVGKSQRPSGSAQSGKGGQASDNYCCYSETQIAEIGKAE